MPFVPGFTLPDRWVETHPLHSWPVKLPDDTRWRRGLAVALLHKSALYESRDDFPDLTEGVLEGLWRLGHGYYEQTAAMVLWRERRTAARSQLSEALAQQSIALRPLLRNLHWLKNDVVLGRGEAANGQFSGALAHNLWCQVVGWMVLTGHRHLADQIIGDALAGLDPSGPPADSLSVLERVLPQRTSAEFEYQETGPDHDKKFTATIRVKGYPSVSVTSGNKKGARRAAAWQFLKEYFPAAMNARSAESESVQPLSTSSVLGRERTRLLRGLMEELRLSAEWEALVDQALIHRSWVYENKDVVLRLRQTDYGRLAWLGSRSIEAEACLSSVEQVMESRPEHYAFLTTKDDMAAKASDLMGLPPLLLLGRGQRQNIPATIKSDAFQAVHAVVTLANGGAPSLPQASDRWARALRVVAPEERKIDDWTTRLQEQAVAMGLAYEFTTEQTGKDHVRQFRSTLTLTSSPLKRRGDVVGSWQHSKKASRQVACRSVVQAIDLVSSQAWCAGAVRGVNRVNTLHLFILNHLLNSLPTTPRELRRWREQGIFRSWYQGELPALFEWAEVMGAFCDKYGIQVEPEGVIDQRLRSAVGLLIEQQRTEDRLMADLGILSSRLNEIATRESPILGELQGLIRDLSWFVAALRGRGAVGREVPLVEYVEGFALLYKTTMELEPGLASRGVPPALQDAVSLWIRGLQDLAVSTSHFDVRQTEGGYEIVSRGSGVKGHESEQLTQWVEFIAPGLRCTTWPSPKLSVAASGGPAKRGDSVMLDALAQGRKFSENTVDATLAGLIHDIKNELSAACGALRTEVQGRTESLRQRLACSEHIDRAVALMSDVLSRTGLLRASLSGQCELPAALRNYVHALMPTLPAGLRFEFEPPSEFLTLPMPEPTLVALVSNAVKNSLESMRGVGTLSIRCQTWASDGALIEISDTGPGFGANVLEQFGRGNVASSKRSGNGIGLLSMRRVVRAVGGEIELSNGESGARVTLLLPEAVEEPLSETEV